MKVDYYELTSAYLDRALNEKEKEAYEIEMSRDNELREATDYFPVIQEVLEAYVQEEARETIRNIRRRESTQEQMGRSIPIFTIINRPVFKYAMAAIIILVIVAYSSLTIFNKQTPDQLFDTYYAVYPNLEISERGVSIPNDTEALRKSAYILYDLGDYKEFIRVITELPAQYPNSVNDRFYLGIAYIEELRWSDAAKEFEQVMLTESTYAGVSQWYLALSYLLSDRCTDAQAIFQTLQETGLDKSKKSKEILRKLKC